MILVMISKVFSRISEKAGFKVTQLFIGTIFAFLVKFLRYTRLESDGSVKKTIYRRQGDALDPEPGGTPRSLLALDIPTVFEIEQNQFQELFRDIFGFGNIFGQEISASVRLA